jgi:hypothetical protein
LLTIGEESSPNKSGCCGALGLNTQIQTEWCESFHESNEVATTQTTIQKYLNEVAVAKSKHKLEKAEKLAKLLETNPKAELSYMETIDICAFWKELQKQK